MASDDIGNLLVFARSPQTILCLRDALWPHQVSDAYALMGYSLLDRRHPFAKDVVNFFQWSNKTRYDAVIVTHQQPIAAVLLAGYRGHVLGFSAMPLHGTTYQCSPDAVQANPALLAKLVTDHVSNVCREKR